MAFHFSGIRLALLWLPHILMLSKCYKEEPKIDTGYSAAAVPFKKTTSTETLHCFPEPQQIRCFISNFRRCWQAIKEWGFKRVFELPKDTFCLKAWHFLLESDVRNLSTSHAKPSLQKHTLWNQIDCLGLRVKIYLWSMTNFIFLQ